MIKDSIPFVSAQQAVRCAYAALDGIQVAFTPAEQVAGVAVLFTEFCEGLQLDPSQVIDAAHRRIAHDDTFFKREVKALRDYVQGEMK